MINLINFIVKCLFIRIIKWKLTINSLSTRHTKKQKHYFNCNKIKEFKHLNKCIKAHNSPQTNRIKKIYDKKLEKILQAIYHTHISGNYKQPIHVCDMIILTLFK